MRGMQFNPSGQFLVFLLVWHCKTRRPWAKKPDSRTVNYALREVWSTWTLNGHAKVNTTEDKVAPALISCLPYLSCDIVWSEISKTMLHFAN